MLSVGDHLEALIDNGCIHTGYVLKVTSVNGSSFTVEFLKLGVPQYHTYSVTSLINGDLKLLTCAYASCICPGDIIEHKGVMYNVVDPPGSFSSDKFSFSCTDNKGNYFLPYVAIILAGAAKHIPAPSLTYTLANSTSGSILVSPGVPTILPLATINHIAYTISGRFDPDGTPDIEPERANPPKCICGSSAINSANHSSWCDIK